jgi:hypothetical protein
MMFLAKVGKLVEPDTSFIFRVEQDGLIADWLNTSTESLQHA